MGGRFSPAQCGQRRRPSRDQEAGRTFFFASCLLGSKRNFYFLHPCNSPAGSDRGNRIAQRNPIISRATAVNATFLGLPLLTNHQYRLYNRRMASSATRITHAG